MTRIRLAGIVAGLLGLLAPLAAAQPAAALPTWETTGSSWENPYGGAPRIVDLRFATHPRFDRVVVDVHGRIPSWRTTYRRTFHYEGSGEVVPIRGRSGIQLVLSPAYAHDDRGRSVYDGPRIARPGFRTLKAIAFTGDFEAHVGFALALRHRAPYRVFWLHDPQRLVIDVKHR